jgi:hypothetical protein
LTGWDATDQKEIYFDTKNTHDIPVAYGKHISMALPGAFKAVDMNLTKYQGHGPIVQSPHKFMDGWMGSNSPNEVFIKPLSNSSSEEERIQHQSAQQKTLTCVFDEEGKGFRADSNKFAYSENWLMRAFLWCLGAIKKAFHVNPLREAENKKLNDTGNVMVVPHGQLGVLSMSPTEEEKRAVDLMSNLLTVDWVRQRGDVAEKIESFELDPLLKHLSLEELKKLEAPDDEIKGAIQAEIARRQQENVSS